MRSLDDWNVFSWGSALCNNYEPLLNEIMVKVLVKDYHNETWFFMLTYF